MMKTFIYILCAIVVAAIVLYFAWQMLKLIAYAIVAGGVILGFGYLLGILHERSKKPK